MNSTDHVMPQQAGCSHCVFGLIVTGQGERDFLPRFLARLTQGAGCSFRVVRRIGQRSPITSPRRTLAMAGTGKTIPDRDEQDIGLPARHFLRNQPCHFLLLIDDVEEGRRGVIKEVFIRYRTAMDTLLLSDEKQRAAVHFFANMLEAYYFAHSAAVNQALGSTVLEGDHAGDVELIRHPKNELKDRWHGFDERAHGALIVDRLDLEHVLANPQTCAYLRSLLAWCVRQLHARCQVWDSDLGQRFQLQAGTRESLTDHQ